MAFFLPSGSHKIIVAQPGSVAMLNTGKSLDRPRAGFSSRHFAKPAEMLIKKACQP